MIEQYPLDGFVLEYMRERFTEYKFNIVLDGFNIIHYFNTNDKGTYTELTELEGYLNDIFNKDGSLENLDILTINAVNDTLKDHMVTLGIVLEDETEYPITISIGKAYVKILEDDNAVKEHYVELLNNTDLPILEQFIHILNEYTDVDYITTFNGISDIVIEYILRDIAPKIVLEPDEVAKTLITAFPELSTNYIVAGIIKGDYELGTTEEEYSKFITNIESWYKPINLIDDLAVIAYITNVEDITEYVFEYLDIDRIVDDIDTNLKPENVKHELYDRLTTIYKET